MEFQANVLRVIDGDTFQIQGVGLRRSLRSGTSVRIQGIDKPERHQYGYEAATEKLAFLISGKKVKIKSVATDVHGRLVADVYIFKVGRWRLLTDYL